MDIDWHAYTVLATLMMFILISSGYTSGLVI